MEGSQKTAVAVLLAFCVALWVWLCWSCLGEWLHQPDYQYGLVVPFLSLYFLLRDGIRIPAHRSSNSQVISAFTWMVLVVVALLCGVVELVRLSPLYWRLLPWGIGILAVSATSATAWLIAGPAGLRKILPPCALMLTAIPWPSLLEQATTIRLMTWVTEIVGTILPYAGVPAQIQGNTLLLPDCMIGVAEACSGIRSLQASLMLAVAAGEMFRVGMGGRALLILVGGMLALLINVLRTLALSFAGLHGGQKAVDSLHNLSAGTALILLAAGIFLTARLLAKKHTSQDSPAFSPLPARLSSRASFAILGMGLGGFLLAHVWYAWRGGMDVSHPPLLSYHQDDESIRRSEPSETLLSLLRPTSGELLMRDFPVPMAAYHFYWEPSHDNAAHLYHRPDVCMPGVGWIPEGTPKKVTLFLDGRETEWVAFGYQRGGVRATLLWASWIDQQGTGLDFGRQINLQHAMTGKLIARGKRKLAYEMAAVFIPLPLESLTTGDYEKAVSAFFGTL